MLNRSSIARACALVLILAGGVQAASAAPAQTPPRNTTPYPAGAHDNFISGCTEDGTVSKPACECMYRHIEQQFTVAEFMEIDAAAEAGQDHPLFAQVVEIAKVCLADTDS